MGIAKAFGALAMLCVPVILAILSVPSQTCAAPLIGQLTLPSTAPAQPGVQLEGTFLTAPITLDGSLLFHLAVAANAPASQVPIAVRQTDVQTTLSELLATTGSGRDAKTAYDPQSFRVHIRNDGDVDSLEAVDAKHSDPLPILTVTSADAQYNQLSRTALASEWQGVLQTALVRALELRQPAVQERSVVLVGRIGVALIAFSLFVWAAVALLRRLANRAKDEAAGRDRETEAERERVGQDAEGDRGRRRRFLAVALRGLEPQRRARLYGSLAEMLIWATILAWFVAFTWAFSLFPETTSLSETLISGSLRVLITLVVAGLVIRILDVVIARLAVAWERRPFVSPEERARLMLRSPTIARALTGFKTFAIVFLTTLAVLGEVGVPIGSVVTIGGLAAIALSLAAQNFVRDFVNGSLVLFEDQYVVGDYVTINAASGIVEHLSLRMVQIRDSRGDVVTIPHSSVSVVVNQSRNWSRVDYRVPVDPASDVTKAIDLIRVAIEDLAKDATWRGQITLPIEWIGIDQLSRDSAIVRASVRTEPLRQFAFRRDINAAVANAFAEAKIAFGAQLPESML